MFLHLDKMVMSALCRSNGGCGWWRSSGHVRGQSDFAADWLVSNELHHLHQGSVSLVVSEKICLTIWSLITWSL